jgi:tRNA modification GTPase
MNERRYGDQHPIAARATPPGRGALALIRTSGERALEILGVVFSRPKALLAAPGNSVVYGWIVDPVSSVRIDEVLVSVYRAPASYTGEDAADISCHGGAAVVRAVLDALNSAGFDDALPGEFSFRAFVNGKLDLTRAESVMELVSAETEAAARRAVVRLSGALEQELAAVKENIVEALASAEILLDYPEEEIEGTVRWRDAVGRAIVRLETLSAGFGRGRIHGEGALAVIAGKPNAGKSSLFNALLAEDRSIVTEFPGTTRDWIEARLLIEDIPVRLVDTAGLRDASGETAEETGIRRSRELIDGADLVFYVIDGAAGPDDADKVFMEADGMEKRTIVVWNKADIAPLPPGFPAVEISAATGAGLQRLCAEAATVLGEGETLSGFGTVRQNELSLRAAAALREAVVQENLELAPLSLREALEALGEITGNIASPNILEAMFSRFCVGK